MFLLHFVAAITLPRSVRLKNQKNPEGSNEGMPGKEPREETSRRNPWKEPGEPTLENQPRRRDRQRQRRAVAGCSTGGRWRKPTKEPGRPRKTPSKEPQEASRETGR